jgi:acyl-CoA reductase-like NAD-dependent aldehyde dehydrogenase
MVIGGERRADGAEGRMESINPFSGEAWATIPVAGKPDVDDALAAARTAFDGTWRATPGVRRGQLIHRLADLLEERADRFAELESTDNGKVIRETRSQIRYVARIYRYYAGWADKLHGEVVPLDSPTAVDQVVREPVGVAALITAWNSPMALLSYKLAPALAAGNCVVVKPSEYASVTTLELVALTLEAGFPPGVVNVVSGGGEVGAMLTGSPGIDKISFTGGPGTGRRVAAAAAEHLTPTILELGGKSPNIVFADADLGRAAVGAVAGIFGAAGQTCIAGSRLLVERPVYDEVVAAVAARADAIRLGDPLDPQTEMGPVANRSQQEQILGMIDAAIADGARKVAGDRATEVDGGGRGYFVSPTVFADVDNSMEIAQREVFGPVLAVIPFEGEDEAVTIANDTDYGLAAGIWTQGIQRAHRVAQRLDAGTVWINTYRAIGAQTPFGGTKGSGYGRERGFAGLLEYMRVKNVMIELSEETRDPFVIKT